MHWSRHPHGNSDNLCPIHRHAVYGYTEAAAQACSRAWWTMAVWNTSAARPCIPARRQPRVRKVGLDHRSSAERTALYLVSCARSGDNSARSQARQDFAMAYFVRVSSVFPAMQSQLSIRLLTHQFQAAASSAPFVVNKPIISAADA